MGFGSSFCCCYCFIGKVHFCESHCDSLECVLLLRVFWDRLCYDFCVMEHFLGTSGVFYNDGKE